jgi:hypothetical protein
MAHPTPAGLGLRVKSGRAVAVVLVGPPEDPVVWKRADLTLGEVRQPYHPFIDLPWSEAQASVEPIAREIQRTSARVVAELVEKATVAGFRIKAAGVVGSSDPDVNRIANSHIRAHAAEGVLFRRALEEAARAAGLRTRYFVEKNLCKSAPKQMTARLRDLGRALCPWRSDEKSAALAAWTVIMKA